MPKQSNPKRKLPSARHPRKTGRRVTGPLTEQEEATMGYPTTKQMVLGLATNAFNQLKTDLAAQLSSAGFRRVRLRATLPDRVCNLQMLLGDHAGDAREPALRQTLAQALRTIGCQADPTNIMVKRTEDRIQAAFVLADR